MKAMHEIVPKQLQDTIKQHKLIAVLSIERQETTIPLIEILYNGGIRIIELVLRTPIALESIRIIKKEFPDMIVGAGTVLTIEQLEAVHKHRVDFAVAPCVNAQVIERALTLEMPFFPGIMTPSDIGYAIQYGARILKYFPASMGGLSHLKAIAAPYAHLDISYIPLGGIRRSHLESYISSPLVGAVGGSWIAPLSLINELDWTQITKNVHDAMAIIKATPNI